MCGERQKPGELGARTAPPGLCGRWRQPGHQAPLGEQGIANLGDGPLVLASGGARQSGRMKLRDRIKGTTGTEARGPRGGHGRRSGRAGPPRQLVGQEGAVLLLRVFVAVVAGAGLGGSVSMKATVTPSASPEGATDLDLYCCSRGTVHFPTEVRTYVYLFGQPTSPDPAGLSVDPSIADLNDRLVVTPVSRCVVDHPLLRTPQGTDTGLP